MLWRFNAEALCPLAGAFVNSSSPLQNLNLDFIADIGRIEIRPFTTKFAIFRRKIRIGERGSSGKIEMRLPWVRFEEGRLPTPQFSIFPPNVYLNFRNSP